MPPFVHPLLQPLHGAMRRAVALAFPGITLPDAPGVLSLHEYLSEVPHRFHDRKAFQLTFEALTGLANSPFSQPLLTLLTEHRNSIDLAFAVIAEINRLPWHDDLLDEKEKHIAALQLSQDMHPAYLRLTEAVLTPLIRVFAHFSRIRRGKQADGLDIWSIAEELKGSDLAHLTTAYRNTVRNGIAHGHVVYRDLELTYTDKKGNQEVISIRDAIRLIDDMVDICNGIVLGYKLFFLTQPNFPTPQEQLFEEIRAATNSPWWMIEGCHSSEAIGPRTQLNIYARVATTDPSKIQHAVFHAGVTAEALAPSYDRYFISWRGAGMLPGFAAFNGHRLQSCRMAAARAPEGYTDVVETCMLAPPLKREKILRPLRRIESFAYAAINVQRARRLEHKVNPQIQVRVSQGHRNAWGVVIDAKVVLSVPDGEIGRDFVRRSRWRIMLAVRQVLEPKLGESRLIESLPTAFCRVAIFRRDFRRRRLKSFGLGEDLVGTLQIQRMARIRVPDILGSEIETRGEFRFAWNRRWIEATEG